MSHHFDTKLAKEDPSLNLCGFYLFEGGAGRTVMAMTMNPDVGLSAADTPNPEGVYAFCFDTNGDAREEVTFKLRFREGAEPGPRDPEKRLRFMNALKNRSKRLRCVA
jgi:hypothetical protein